MREEDLFTLNDGKILIDFARRNIETYLKKGRTIVIPEEIKNKYSNDFGVFVTLNVFKAVGNPLRGCIGYPEPIFPLFDAIHKASIKSATEDPRFPTVSIEEMDNIVIELSILTPPKLIEVQDINEYLTKIVIGRDGLIIEKGWRKGLLLPQVPVDHGRNWDVRTYLEHTCLKAGLNLEAWKESGTKIYSFQGILFEEKEPNGEVYRKYIKRN
jgi:uncharacterized protein (TIGR00296 family)